MPVRSTLVAFIFALSFQFQPVQAADDKLYRRDYEGFTVWLDCTQHGAIRFRYNAQHDTGSFDRSGTFKLDPEVPAECQQTSAKSYKSDDTSVPNYERGHLVPANHLDYSEVAIQQSNYMTNILPQTATFNRGAWLATEEIIECYRDIDELLVIGGVIWGTDASNDYFVADHGIRTPDAFWKVVIRGNGKTIAWIIPNDTTATRKSLDKFLVTPAKIEKRTGQQLPEVPKGWRTKRPAKSWGKPVGCDLG